VSGDDLTLYRLEQLDKAVETMAHAAAEQQEFNTTVERFMERITTWGRVLFYVYTISQGIALIMIAYALAHVRFVP